MSWIAFLFAVEVGMAAAPAWLVTVPEPEYLDQVVQLAPALTAYTMLEVEAVILDLFRVGGAVATYSIRADGTLNYAPWTADYWVWAGLEHQGMSIGWRHICHHAIVSSARPQVGYLFGGGDVFYMRFEGLID